MPSREPERIATFRLVGMLALLAAGFIARQAGLGLGNVLIGGAVVWLLIAVVLQYRRNAS